MASPTILLVDDDIAVLASLSKLLNHFGYVVAGASNSGAAMDYVTNAKQRFDLILTDLVMPNVDGMAFLTAAKNAFPDVPVILMTGCAERCTPDTARQMGAFAFLPKPLDTRVLVNTIERALH